MRDFSFAVEKGLFHFLDKFSEDFWVLDSHLREDFTIKSDTFFFLHVDESSVGKSMKTKSVVEADDPEATEVTLLGTTVTVSVFTSLNDSFLSCTEQVFASPTETFSLLEKIFMALLGLNASFDSGHSDSFLIDLGLDGHGPLNVLSHCWVYIVVVALIASLVTGGTRVVMVLASSPSLELTAPSNTDFFDK